MGSAVIAATRRAGCYEIMTRMAFPSGCYPADAWSGMLNVPVDDVYRGATVYPLGGQGMALTFVACRCEDPRLLPPNPLNPMEGW